MKLFGHKNYEKLKWQKQAFDKILLQNFVQ